MAGNLGFSWDFLNNIFGGPQVDVKPLDTTQTNLGNVANTTGQPLFQPKIGLQDIGVQSINTKTPTVTPGSQSSGGLGFNLDTLTKLAPIAYGMYNDSQNRKRTDFALENNARKLKNDRQRSRSVGKSMYGKTYEQPGEDYDTSI